MKKGLLFVVAVALCASSAQATIVLNEPFTYSNGALITVSGGLWSTHSGTTSGQVDVTANAVNIVGTETEDVNASIVGTPGFFYNSGTLTANFDVTFSVLPTAAGTYFAHFKDSTAGGFRSRLFATTTGAAVGTFRLAIADTTATIASFAQDLTLGITYSVSLLLDAATGRSSFSVNGNTPVVATDATSFLPISTFALRQSTNEGTLTLDNLTVDASAPAVPEPTTLVSLLGGVGMLMGFRRLRGSYGSTRREPASAR